MHLSRLSSKRLWFTGFLLWVAYLFTLSSNPESVTQGAPEIPHIDKILHFGYFLGGAGLFSTWILLWKLPDSRRTIRVLAPIIVLCTIGAFDEFHQSLSPGRSGNDPIDWLADALGAVIGVFTANRFHHLLRGIPSHFGEKSQN